MKMHRTIWGLLAAFLAVSLIFGCGGGGSDPIITPPPDDSITTEVRAVVKDARGRLVNGAIVTGADENSQTGADGRFSARITGKRGETKTLHLTHAAGVADIRVPLANPVMTLVDPVVLSPLSREETFETTPAPQGVTVFPTIRVLNNGVVENWLPDEMAMANPAGVEVRTYTEPGYNNGKKYLFATSQTETDVHFEFKNVPEGEGMFTLLRTGRITFVTPTDSVKPAVTQVRVPEGLVSGRVNVDGKVEDLYEDIYFAIDVTVSRQQTVDLAPMTRDFNGHHIEGPPSGPDWLTVKAGDQQLARTEEFAEDGSFEVTIDTTALANGPVELIFVVQDKAGNLSNPVRTTIQVQNGPMPLPASDRSKRLGFTGNKVVLPYWPYYWNITHELTVTADGQWVTGCNGPEVKYGYIWPGNVPPEIDPNWVYLHGIIPPNGRPDSPKFDRRYYEDPDNSPQIVNIAAIGDKIVVFANWNELRVYDSQSRQMLKQLKGVDYGGLRADPDGGFWLVLPWENGIELIRYTTDLEISQTCRITGNPHASYCILPIRYQTAFGIKRGIGNTVEVIRIDLQTGNIVDEWPVEGAESPGEIFFDPQTNQLVIITSDSYRTVYSVQTRSLTGELITAPIVNPYWPIPIQEPTTGRLYGVEHVNSGMKVDDQGKVIDPGTEAIIHELGFQ